MALFPVVPLDFQGLWAPCPSPVQVPLCGSLSGAVSGPALSPGLLLSPRSISPACPGVPLICQRVFRSAPVALGVPGLGLVCWWPVVVKFTVPPAPLPLLRLPVHLLGFLVCCGDPFTSALVCQAFSSQWCMLSVLPSGSSGGLTAGGHHLPKRSTPTVKPPPFRCSPRKAF